MARFTTEELTRSTVYDTADNKIGGVGQVYLDDRTGDPKWVSVNTGFFGMGESFIPLRGARQDGDRLVVDYSEDVVKDAPRVEGDKHITEAEEEELFSYYSGVHDRDSDRYHDRDRYQDDDDDSGWFGFGGDKDKDRDVTDRDVTDRDRTDRGVTDDTETMTRSEEQLRVGTEQQETGRARLRKYTTTEEETVTVPVEKERLVVEREPIEGDGTRSAGSIGDGDGDVEEDIVLREERPVVDKETVDVENVRVGKETVTDDQTVTEEVRKEHIDVDGEGLDEQGNPRNTR